MATIGAKAITVPVYPSLTAEDATFIINHSEAKIAILENTRQLHKLITFIAEHQNLLPHLRTIVIIEPYTTDPKLERGIPQKIISFDELKRNGRIEESKNPSCFSQNLLSADPDELITICYTSGTTGLPKGAMLTHKNMMSVLEDCVRVFNRHISPEKEVLLSFLPFSHILGKVESMAIYVFGWQQWFAESFEKLTTNLKDARPTLLFGVPRTFEKAYEKIILSVNSSPPFLKNLYKLSTSTGGGISWSAKLAVSAARLFIFRKIRNGFGGRLKWAICGGAPLPKELGEFFHKVGITILEGYGLTETCAPVTLNTPNNIRFGSVGRPLPEVSIKTAPDGEILVKSEKIFKGYFKLPEETTSAFQDGWFCTGDIGSFDKDGFLQITERKKDLIVTSSGKNIAPQKMEGIAKSYVLINQFIVHGDNRNYLTALITLNKEQAIKYATDHQVLFSEYTELVKNPRMIGAMQKIVDDINKHLAKYEKIKRFLILPNEFTVENGELTPSLKFKRSLINKRYKNLLDSMYALSTEY